MSLEQIVEKLPLYKRIETLLVVEADFVGFRAAVLHKKGQTLSVVQHASAESLDMQEAVKSLIEELQKQGLKAQHAILLTPSVLSTLVELNVPPKNKLTSEQMAEAVRWELEPLLTQHQRLLTVGQILLSNGNLNEEQLAQVIAMQEADNLSKSRDVVFKRFGEYATELGSITKLQLERALAKQAWFLGSTEQVQVNWTAQSKAADNANPTFPWLVSGMSKPLLREWQAAFSQHGVKLLQCYPLAGAALPGLPSVEDNKLTKKQSKAKANSPEKLEALFDLQEGLLSAVAFHPSQGISQTYTVSAHEPYLSHISALYPMLGLKEVANVYLINAASKTEQEANLLQDDIQQALQVEMKPVAKPSTHVSAAMRGAAKHLLLKQAPNLATAVPVADPLPPLMQRFEVRAVLGALLLVALMLFAEASLLVRTYWVKSQLETIAPDAKKIDDAIARIKNHIAEVKKYKEEIKTKTKEEETLQRNFLLLSKDLPKRNQTLQQFLQAFEQTVSEDVVIDRVEENTILGFTITGWSISEQSAQEFVRKFQIAIHSFGYRLKDITVNQQTGRLGLLGYAINFKATTLDEKAWINAKLGKTSVTTPNTAGVKK